MAGFEWLLKSLGLSSVGLRSSRKSSRRHERRSRFLRPLRMERLQERTVFSLPSGPPGNPGGPDNDQIGDPWEGIIVLPPGDGIGLDPSNPVPMVNVSVDHSQIFENGNPRLSTQFRFTKPSGTGAIQVNYAIDGSATFGNDYTLSGNTLRSLVIPANATSATLTVTAVNDTVVDPEEFVKATLLPGPGYVVGNRVATTTIVDDEPAPPTVTLSVDYTTMVENDPFAISTFTITRNGTAGALTVNYFLSGTAIYNTDYSGPMLTLENGNPQGSVTIPNGQSSATFSVEPIDDSIYDANETIIAAIKASSSYTIVGGPKTVTIVDNEQPPGLPPAQPVSVVALGSAIFESQPESPVKFKIMRGGSTENALVVNYKFTGSATIESDYTAPGAATDSITIPAGASFVTFDVSAVDDNIDDDNETVGVSILPGSSYQVASTSSASVTIIDNDDPPLANVWVRADKVSIAEAAPSIPVTFTFTRDGVLSQPLTVNYRVSGDAEYVIDYFGPGAATGSITFAEGESTKTIQAFPINDLIDDDHESFGVNIRPGTGYHYRLGNGTRVYIEDNDGPYYDPPQYVSVSVDRELIFEESPNVPATFTITRNVPWGDLQVRYYIGGSATLNEDYHLAPTQGWEGEFGYRTITIPSDQWSVSFQAFPIDDDYPDNFETISVMLGTGPGYIAYSDESGYYGYAAMTTIVDNDQPPPPPPQPPPPITFDLDIDSNNNNGFDYPVGTDADWEEKLEDHEYAIGKLVLSNAFGLGENGSPHNFTPVRLRLPRGADPADPNTRIRIDYDQESSAGHIRLFRKSKRERPDSDDISLGGDFVTPGFDFSLADLLYNPADGGITLWIEGRAENPAIKTLKGLETNGLPNEYITATLRQKIGIMFYDFSTDKVKYVVTQKNSVLWHLQFHQNQSPSAHPAESPQNNPTLRHALATRGVYGSAPNDNPYDLPNFGMKKQSEAELNTLDVPLPVRNMLFRSLVVGFKAAVYQDFLAEKDETFILAFAGTEDRPDWIDDFLQGAGYSSPQYVEGLKLGVGLKAVPAFNGEGKLTATGHSLGGGLASAVAVAANIKAETFNAAGLKESTLYLTPTGIPHPGSIERFHSPNALVKAHYSDYDFLTYLQNSPATLGLMPKALGEQRLLDSYGDQEVPYDLGSLLTALSNIDDLTDLANWVHITRLDVVKKMITLHSAKSYLYGLLVKEEPSQTNITEAIVEDLLGYEPYDFDE